MHAENCKAYKTGFHGSCDCGEYERKKEEIIDSYGIPEERNIVFKIIISRVGKDPVELRSAVIKAFEKHIAELNEVVDPRFGFPGSKIKVPGHCVIDSNTILTWQVVENPREQENELAMAGMDKLYELKNSLCAAVEQTEHIKAIIQSIDQLTKTLENPITEHKQ